MLILGIIILCLTAIVCCAMLRPGIPQEEGIPRIGFVLTGDDSEGDGAISPKTNSIGIPEFPEVKRLHEPEVIDT